MRKRFTTTLTPPERPTGPTGQTTSSPECRRGIYKPPAGDYHPRAEGLCPLAEALALRVAAH
ncbi:MAG: hypothetical protein ACRDZR_15220, partial [Acidimicrobiales bacterium]